MPIHDAQRWGTLDQGASRADRPAGHPACLGGCRRRYIRHTRLQLAAALAMLSWGCFHPPTPYLPPHWPGTAQPVEALADTVARPVLQVIIAYNVYWPNHTALRLVDASGKTIFWDPGGGFGKNASGIVRHSDLITDQAPDLAGYMRYRWSQNDQAVEIFEWVLAASEGRRLAAALREGAARTAYTESGFRTATPGLFCNAAVSSFLYDHGRPSIHLGDSYMLPNLLSRELYTRHPDRVMVLKRDHRKVVLILRPPQTQQKFADLPRQQPEAFQDQSASLRLPGPVSDGK